MCSRHNNIITPFVCEKLYSEFVKRFLPFARANRIISPLIRGEIQKTKTIKQAIPYENLAHKQPELKGLK